MYGHNVSHSKRRTRKIFKPNLHEARVLIGNQRRRMRLCTKCLRTYRRMEALKNNPIKEVVAVATAETTSAAV
jgi:large subunit ribosomal protein L28